jgi:hypothetical protein
MTTHALPVELLNKLFTPSTSFVDLATRLHRQSVEDEDFEKLGEKGLDLLEFNVEIHDVPEEFSSNKTSVFIDDQSRKMMIDTFKQLGSTIAENQKEIRDDAVKALLYDLNEKLSSLDAPEMETLRTELDVQLEWMEAVGSLGAFHDLMEYARQNRTPQWWSWFLEGAAAPILTGEGGVVAAITLLSRRHRGVALPPYPPEYAEPWADWALRGTKWKSLGVMHGLWLASALSDPEKKLANQLDARGFKFDIERVQWDVAVVHANNINISEKDPLKCYEVERFLTRHLEQLVKLGPEFARNPYPTDLEKDGWASQKAKHLSGKNGIAGLIENVIKTERRKEMVAELNRHVLALDTPSAKEACRSSPRL